MVIVILVVLGLALGSFVNAFVWRLHKGRDWVRERSECTHCHHELAAKDLVPVLSYLWLRGRCRYCRKPIQDSPLTELITPLLFVVSYLYWPYALHGAGLFTFCLWLVFLVGFVALGLYDLRWFLLPDKIVFPLIGLAGLQVLVMAALYHGGWPVLLGAAWGVVIDSGIFYLLFQLSGGKWIGGGDVKLGIVLGLLVGGPGKALLLLFIASLLGTLVALPLLLSGKAKRSTPLPFGPFLLAGAVITVLFGTRLIGWYMSQFLR